MKVALNLISLIDPRYIQLFILAGYAIAARESFGMERLHLVTFYTCAVAVVTDLLVGKFRYGQFRFPISALIIGFACSLLLDSREIWVHPLAAFIAVLSKGFILHSGKHYFNPANFGVVCLLLICPLQATGVPALFAGYLHPSLVFFAAGVVTVIIARQTLISFSWIAGFILFAFIRSSFTDVSFLVNLLPILGPSFLLFSFHMISDPATTPKKPSAKIAFAIAVAALDAVFRYKEIPYGNFYALFICGGFMPLFNPWASIKTYEKADSI